MSTMIKVLSEPLMFIGRLQFLARKNVCRVFNLCCLVVVKPRCEYHVVDIDLGGCTVSELVVASCIRGVQSYVKAGSRVFMALTDFGTWARPCCGGQNGNDTRPYLMIIWRERKMCSMIIFVIQNNVVVNPSLTILVLRSTTVTCAEIHGSSVVGGSETCSGPPSKEKKYSSLASLLGRKREDADSVETVAKKSTKASGNSASKGAGPRSKRRQILN